MMTKKIFKRFLVIFMILLTLLTSASSASNNVEMDSPCVVIHAGEYPR